MGHTRYLPGMLNSLSVSVLEHRVRLKCNIFVKLKMAALLHPTHGGRGTRVRLKQSLREANTLEGDRRSARRGSDSDNTLDTARENVVMNQQTHHEVT